MDSLNSRKRKKGDDDWGEPSKRIPVGNRVVPINEENLLKFHITEDPSTKLELATTMFASFTDDEISPNQLCVNYCSMLTCFLPRALDVSMKTFEYWGMRVHVVSTEAERQETGFVMERPMNVPHALISLGQSLLLLLKDVPAANYEKYMENRIKAMKSIAGIPSDVMVNPVMSFARAKIIRGHVLKAPIAKSMLSASAGTDRMSCLLSYIARILEFTEMSGLSFIYDILVLDRSPILKDPSLLWEVRNAAQAFKAIHSTPYPRHFKLLYEPEKTRITARQWFPTLVAVEQSLKADQDPSARRFIGGKKDDDERVAAFKVLHNEAPIDTATLNYLYGIRWMDSGAADDDTEDRGGGGDETEDYGVDDDETAALDYLYKIVGMDCDDSENPPNPPNA